MERIEIVKEPPAVKAEVEFPPVPAAAIAKKDEIRITEEPEGKGVGKRGKDKTKRKPREKKAKSKKVNLKQYEDHPLALAVNWICIEGLNRSLLSDNKFTEEEEKGCKMGQAVVYTLDRYELPIDHPLVVLLGAGAEFAGLVLAKKLEAMKNRVTKKKSKQTPKTED